MQLFRLMSVRKKSKPLVFRNSEIDALMKTFPDEIPDLKRDLTGFNFFHVENSI